jgi:hypothetical protein
MLTLTFAPLPTNLTARWRDSRWAGCRCIALAHNSHTSVCSGGGSIAVPKITDMQGFKKKVKLVFVSYGSNQLAGDRTVRGGDPKANTDGLKAPGINAHFYVPQDTAHEWQSWGLSLRELAPLLFKD